MTDAQAEAAYGTGWRSPETMPAGRIVTVRSVRGREVRAYRDDICEPYGWPGLLRIKCHAYTYKSTLSAICWKP